MKYKIHLTTLWTISNNLYFLSSPNVFNDHYPEEKLLLSSSDRHNLWTPNISIRHLISFNKLHTLHATDSLRVVPQSKDEFYFLHQGNYVVEMKCPMEFNTFPFDNHDCFFQVRQYSKCLCLIIRKHFLDKYIFFVHL